MLNALLMEAVSRSTGLQGLSNIEHLVLSAPEDEIRAVFRLKQCRLLWGIDERPDETTAAAAAQERLQHVHLQTFTQSQSQPRKALVSKALRLKSALLLRDPTKKLTSNRELAIYNTSEVFVEWKFIEHTLEAKLRPRIEGLGVLLHDAKDESFHTLHCRGFFKDVDSDRFAFVFDIPSFNDIENAGPAPGVKTLRELIALDCGKPNLDARFNLAIALAETVLNLHTVGWLHKAICSDNVIFFGYDGKFPPTPDISSPYLAGFEYARSDNPLEISDEPPSSLEQDIYRHPLATGQAKVGFRKRFDLYALGLVLLEVGLWKTIASMHEWEDLTVIIEDQSQQSLLGMLHRGTHSIIAQLEFCAGKDFADAVLLCLGTGERNVDGGDIDGIDDGDDDDMYHLDTSIATETVVLEKLRKRA